MTKRNIIIVDLDGTLCDSGWREMHAQNKDWEMFHGLGKADAPHEDVKALIGALNTVTDGMVRRYHVVACTGRNEKYREQTIRWMVDNDIHVDELIMRPDGDWRSDHELKPELFEATYDKDAVLIVLDDREKVVQAWRDRGYNCWQVRPGGY